MIGPKTDDSVINEYTTSEPKKYAQTLMDTSLNRQRAKNLRTCNIAAAILHMASFIGALVLVILYASQSLQTELTTDFRTYNGVNFVTTIRSITKYQIAWIELPFPLITSLFHFIIAFSEGVRAQYSFNAIINETNWLRWFEYSITASFMTWVIMQLSGITNILTLVFAGVLSNVALQIQGYTMELLNTPAKRRMRGGRVNWAPTIAGWFIFIGQWTIIITYFLSSVISNPDDIPIFVYLIVFVLFFQFSLFGFLQALHYSRWPRFLASGYGVELAYVTLSFVSKLSLDWILIAGILINAPSSFYSCCPCFMIH